MNPGSPAGRQGPGFALFGALSFVGLAALLVVIGLAAGLNGEDPAGTEAPVAAGEGTAVAPEVFRAGAAAEDATAAPTVRRTWPRRAAEGITLATRHGGRLGIAAEFAPSSGGIVVRRPSTIVRRPRPEPEEEPPRERLPVVIKAYPPAVQIVVDGVFRGAGRTAPLQLAPGRHEVILRHPACPECAETRRGFMLDAAHPPTEPLAFRIHYKPARVRLNANVADAVRAAGTVILVDGAAARREGDVVVVPLGEERSRSAALSVSAAGYAPWYARVTVAADTTTDVRVALRPRAP